MAEDGDSGGGGLLAEMFGAIFSLVGEMLSAFFGVLPKILSFVLWVVVAIIVLPCVWVAGVIYPAWVKWGSDF